MCVMCHMSRWQLKVILHHHQQWCLRHHFFALPSCTEASYTTTMLSLFECETPCCPWFSSSVGCFDVLTQFKLFLLCVACRELQLICQIRTQLRYYNLKWTKYILYIMVLLLSLWQQPRLPRGNWLSSTLKHGKNTIFLPQQGLSKNYLTQECVGHFLSVVHYIVCEEAWPLLQGVNQWPVPGEKRIQ